jgi:hypothetical protein
MSEELFSTQAAAELIDETVHELGGAGYWVRYLTNNRREDRNPPHRVPFVKMGTGAFYTREDLAEFIEFEKNRRIGVRKLSGRAAEVMRAYGIGAAGGGTTGRNLDCTIQSQADPASRGAYVQLIVNNPLLVFRVELAQAKVIHADLGKAIKACERATQ